MVLSLVIANILTGILTSRVGYYMPFLICGICVTAVGAGMLTSLGMGTTVAQWIGYQILYGYGLGNASQAPNMAAQTVLPRNEASIGISIMFFGQTLFGAIFVSVGQNVLDSQLARRLSSVPGITPGEIERAGATGLFDIIPSQYHSAILNAYNDSLRVCFQVALTMCCLSIIGGLGMEWLSVKKNKGWPSRNSLKSEENIEDGNGGTISHEKEEDEPGTNPTSSIGKEAINNIDRKATTKNT